MNAAELIQDAENIVILQSESPDGDSLASSLALEQILGDQGKNVTLYCRTEIPNYLRYLTGWDRVQAELPADFDISIMVDNSVATLMSRTLEEDARKLSQRPFIIIDHHVADVDMPFETVNMLDSSAVAAGEIIYQLAVEQQWNINSTAQYMLATAIIADSANFTIRNTRSETFRTMAELMEMGLDLYQLRQDWLPNRMVSRKIVQYKGELLQRLEYHGGGRIVMTTIPWSEIEEYSAEYNPAELVLHDSLLIKGVQLVCIFKVYDQRNYITGKLRAHAPVANQIAQHFGGGGHDMSAGMRVEGLDIEALKEEFIETSTRLLDEYAQQSESEQPHG